ncbi:MAG: 5'-3' exonuclease [Lentisphaeria bacterium]|nr:5'-3' exonuclease [Lentisphaeria bacterium]
MAEDNKKIVLVDAYSQIFRAFYAVKSLSNSKGFPTNALHGFIKILMRLNREYPSSHGAVVFDCGRVGFRMELNPEYKANRKPTPDELKMQVPPIREFIEAFGWTLLEECEYEADDLIGAIARNFDGEVKFLSSDKDLSQLINSKITQLVPDIKNAFTERTPEKVIEKFGVSADLLIDYLALLGDSADNIPGAAGIGPKGAAKILNNYGSLQQIFADPSQVSDEKTRAKLLENRDLLEKNIALITLKTDLPDKFSKLEQICAKKAIDFAKLFALCDEYELNSIRKDIEKLAKEHNFIPPKAQKKSNADDLFSNMDDSLFACNCETKPEKVAPNEPTYYQADLFE